jgi:deazaflavin-dependent oxidoreductase (nitroreductase family)
VPLPQSLARFNRKVTNQVTRPFAARLPGFGVVTHVGRRSGTVYRTPVNVFRGGDGFDIALTYGGGDWVRNVVAAGQAGLRTRGRLHHVVGPELFHDPARRRVPAPVRPILGLLHVDDFLHVTDAGLTEPGPAEAP